MLVLNAFSINMLKKERQSLSFRPISLERAQKLVSNSVDSAVGHADTARVFSQVLGVPVPANRSNVVLEWGQQALVGQYTGPRLPEGATELPKGATIQWWLVYVEP